MKTLIVGLFMFILWNVPSLASATPHEDQAPPAPGEEEICIPTTPIGFSKECDGQNPPEYCNNYDPDYGDWFIPGKGGIFEVLFGGIRHAYAD